MQEFAKGSINRGVALLAVAMMLEMLMSLIALAIFRIGRLC
jgi:hypothetical protein